jgi:hypothetical protein
MIIATMNLNYTICASITSRIDWVHYQKNEIYLDQNVLPIGIRHYNNGVVTFRSVNRVYLIDGNIYADLKCVDSYEITCTEVVDLYKIAKAISSIIEK